MTELTAIQSAARDFLQNPNQLTAVIATSDRDGIPHAATVYYYLDRELTFYFLTATGTTKYDHLVTNPHTAIVVGTGPAEITIQGQGMSRLLKKGSNEEAVAMVKIKKRLTEHDGTWPIFQVDQFDNESLAVFAFTPETLRLLNLDATSTLPQTVEEITNIIAP